jgi:hypothetical protein
MKAVNAIISLSFLWLIYNPIRAQESDPLFAVYKKSQAISFVETEESGTDISTARNRAANATGTINLFIFNKEEKFNLASFGFRINTRIAQLFH